MPKPLGVTTRGTIVEKAHHWETNRMTIPVSDFDAAKAVADQLAGMDKDRQQRILRWVAESLSLQLGAGIALPPVPAGGAPQSREGTPSQVGGIQQRPATTSDIKSFVELKKPKSDVQFATVVAYYYRFEAPQDARRDAIDASGLQDAARLAGRRRPPSPKATLNNAKTLGYLDSAERGQFRINSVGENLVAMTLPGGESGALTRKRRHLTRSKKSKGLRNSVARTNRRAPRRK